MIRMNRDIPQAIACEKILDATVFGDTITLLSCGLDPL